MDSLEEYEGYLRSKGTNPYTEIKKPQKEGPHDKRRTELAYTDTPEQRIARIENQQKLGVNWM